MKVTAHQRYGKGKDYPGVTTVLNILEKKGLVRWANNLGLRGIDSNRFTTEAAEIGTLAHEMILSHFTGDPCDTKDYSANQIEKAKRSLTLFYKWVETYKPEPILIEAQLNSHRFEYGGTIDLFAILTIGGQRFMELVDFKTGSGPWPTQFAQLAAYENLLKENGYGCENSRMVKVPANFEAENFAESQLLSLEKYWKLFLHCLAIYRMKIL